MSETVFQDHQPVLLAEDFRVCIEKVKERLHIVCGGKLEISSAPGRGTRITIILPKENEA